MTNEWFYLNAEEQVGPYPGEQLHELIASGAIQRNTLLWTEGMEEWLPAEQIDNLFPETVAPVTQVVAQAQVTTGTVASPEVGNNYPLPPFPIKKANFGLHIWMGLIIPLIAGGILLIALTIIGGSSAAEPEGVPSDGAAAGFAIILLFTLPILYILPIVGAIIGYVHLYRAWTILQPGMAQTTPGQAIGFLFIPFFNLYWIFIAYKGFATDWNRIMSSYEDTKHAPKMNEGVFLWFCIAPLTLVLSFLSPIFYYMAHSQICKGINFFANRSKLGSNTVAGSVSGVKLY